MDKLNKDDRRTIAMKRTQVLSGMRRQRVSYLDIRTQRILKHRLGEKTIIGRNDTNHLCLPFANVSLQHGVVFKQGDEFILQDNDSTNGIYVNGIKVARCVLRPNDLIQIGESRVYYTEREELCM